jgi:hypothetical protein
MTTNNRFPVAVEIDLDQATDAKLRLKNYKALVNRDNNDQVFNVVSRGYTMAQHDEVSEKQQAAMVDLKLEHDTKEFLLIEGARLHLVTRFPNIGLAVEGEYFNMTLTIDNSYDSTTGLRVEIGAVKDSVQCFIHERFASSYHKHTKGLKVKAIEDSITKGITTFQNKVKAEFERMVQAAIDPAKVSIKFGELTTDENTVLPKKYVEEIKKAVDAKKPTTQWRLYRIVMDVMATFDLSVERRRQLTHALVSIVRSL